MGFLGCLLEISLGFLCCLFWWLFHEFKYCCFRFIQSNNSRNCFSGFNTSYSISFFIDRRIKIKQNWPENLTNTRSTLMKNFYGQILGFWNYLPCSKFVKTGFNVIRSLENAIEHNHVERTGDPGRKSWYVDKE